MPQFGLETSTSLPLEVAILEENILAVAKASEQMVATMRRGASLR